MKGIVLAGGTGTRLQPLTCIYDPDDPSKIKKHINNKHLLPIYNKQMIMHPILKLHDAGIKNIMVITGGEKPGDFLEIFGSGRNLNVNGRKISVDLTFRYQSEPGGIAQALSLCEDFVDNEKCVVMLGDNLIEDDITPYVEDFKNSRGAKVLLKKVPDPQHFGVARIENGKVVEIVEKPSADNIPSNYAVVGLYMYDRMVWDIVWSIKPSRRGELEITDVNNEYIRRDCLSYNVLNGFWLDSGSSFEHLLRASMWTAQSEGIDVIKIAESIQCKEHTSS